jgi:hypothetical protein
MTEAEAGLANATAQLQLKQAWIDEHLRRLRGAEARITELELWYEELSSQRDSLVGRL